MLGPKSIKILLRDACLSYIAHVTYSSFSWFTAAVNLFLNLNIILPEYIEKLRLTDIFDEITSTFFINLTKFPNFHSECLSIMKNRKN